MEARAAAARVVARVVAARVAEVRAAARAAEVTGAEEKAAAAKGFEPRQRAIRVAGVARQTPRAVPCDTWARAWHRAYWVEKTAAATWPNFRDALVRTQKDAEKRF